MIDRLKKYCGVIPAFYACYDDSGEVSAQRTRALARYLVDKGVKGLYVGGSSGECIYLEKEERMATLEAVMAEVRGQCTVIAHVACNNTRESRQLAAHAEGLGVDAIGCRTTPSRNTGTTSPPPRPTRISSSTTSPSWPGWR